MHSFSIYRALNLNKTCVCKTQNNVSLVLFDAVAEIAAQIKRVSSLEAITELCVHRGVTVAFSFFFLIILLKIL